MSNLRPFRLVDPWRRCALLLAVGSLALSTAVVPALTADAHAEAVPARHHQSAARPQPQSTITAARSQSAARHVTQSPGGRIQAQATVAQPSRGGLVDLTVTGAASAVAAAVRTVGGRVLASANGQSEVLVPKTRLNQLSSYAGVEQITAPVRPHATGAGPSESVAATGASTWITAGNTASGVKVAIVDLGFGTSQSQYQSEVTAGHLGVHTTVVNEDCVDSTNASTPYDGQQHGLATSEIVQQEAPGAVLTLYCVNSLVGLSQAESAIAAAGIKLVSMSVEWTLDARGDGTGTPNSAAATVAKARKAGILWINSAGNDVPQHYGGTMVDRNNDGLVDMGNASQSVYPYESNFYYVAGTSGAGSTDADFELQWDQWPSATTPVTLEAYGVQCTSAFSNASDAGLDGCHGEYIETVPDIKHTYGYTPTLSLDLADYGVENTSSYDQIWQVVIEIGKGTPAVRYDLEAFGDLDGPSDLSCTAYGSSGCTKWSAAAVNGSVNSPANSPYAFAVGAADVGADGTARGTLESFSSHGPTIDGRVKPDITGWDGVSTYITGEADVNGYFYGTSAAAPSVAGAAALVAGLHPTWDASQLQNFLEQRAGSGSPTNPPSNATGHGLLTLGSPSTTALPTGTQYHALTPTRLIDTRTPTHRQLGAGGTVTVAVPNLPAGTSSVAINLTGVGATGPTYLSAYPAGTAWPGTSNLDLAKSDPTAAVFAVVTVGTNNSITIRNAQNKADVVVDLLGYFGAQASGTGGLVTISPTRVLDTRRAIGTSGTTPLRSGQSIVVNPGLPSNATAAVVTVTSTGAGHPGYFSLTPACPTSTPSSSTLDYTSYTRANAAVEQLASNGTFCLTNELTSAHALVDVVGYFTSDGSGAGYVSLPSATRIVDTRTNNGMSSSSGKVSGIAKMAATSFTAGGVGDLPHSATALLTGVVEAGAISTGYITALPGNAAVPPTTSSIDFTAGRVVANAAFVGLSAASNPATSTFKIYNASPNALAAVVDVFGYFMPQPTG